MTEDKGAGAVLPASVANLQELIQGALARFEPQFEMASDTLVVRLEPKDIRDVCRIAKEHPRLRFDYLSCLSGVDWGEQLEVVYHLYSTVHGHKVVFKVRFPAEAPVVSSVSSVWRAADWHEREAAEMFGITFEGHPKLEPLLLWEGFEGHPLRKSYPLPEIPER